MQISSLTTKVGNITALGFILGTAVLGFVAILGVWDFLDNEIIEKSFATIGLLVFVTVVILIASKYVGRNETPTPWPIFSSIQRITIGSLVISSALLALVGVLSIWEVLEGVSVGRSVASLAIIAFISLVTVMVCLERKGLKLMQPHLSPGRMIGWFIFVVFIFWFIASFGYGLFY